MLRTPLGSERARVIGLLDDFQAAERAGAEARLRSLGGVPGARPSRELAAVCGVVADPGVSDRSKLALLLGRLPAREDAPLDELVRQAEGDAETHALLETIVDDERATVRWLRRMRDVLEQEGA